LAASACLRFPEAQTAPSAQPASPELDRWNADAGAMLQDALQALRTFDVFAAYRVSGAAGSGMRSSAELAWDPPTSAAWDDATHTAHGLHGRADQLFQSVTAARVDQSVWREQRLIADVAADIHVVGDSLAAYRDRLDSLAPGDASGALTLLDRAWAQWEATAARLGMGRSEAIASTDQAGGA
jgi:hypothetical protein